MHLDQMNLLIDLAQTHSFNQTAERYYTTQQNVSYNVKQLEQELGIKIFTRSKSGVAFTAEGEYVLECAIKMQDAYKTLQNKLNGENEAPTQPNLNLYISSSLYSAKMPEIIKSYNQSCPNGKLAIKEIHQEAVIPALLDGNCDIAIWSVNQGYGKDLIKTYFSDVISYSVIAKDTPIAVVSAESKLAQKDTLTIQDLSCVSKSMFGLQPIDYFGKNAAPYILYADDNIAIHQQLILEGNAICFTAQKLYDHLFPKEKFKAVQFDYPTLPIYHIILQRKMSKSVNSEILEKIIAEQI